MGPVLGSTYGGSWGAGGRIVFATDSGLFRIDALGSSPARVPGGQFQILGSAVELFTGRYDFTQTGNWTLGPGGRFLMIKADPTTTTRFHVVLNWFEELRAQARESGSR